MDAHMHVLEQFCLNVFIIILCYVLFFFLSRSKCSHCKLFDPEEFFARFILLVGFEVSYSLQVQCLNF